MRVIIECNVEGIAHNQIGKVFYKIEQINSFIRHNNYVKKCHI